MDRDTMLARLRAVIDDVVSSYNWSDATLLTALAEGQDVFCEETGFFRDKTTHTITLETGTRIYAIPDRIIQVLDIWDGLRKLEKMDADSSITSVASGDPAAWRTDYETGKIEFDREPTATENGDSFALYVWRYSATALDAGNAEPEISSRFHQAPIEWAAHILLDDHDMDYGDAKKAADHGKNFWRYVKAGQRAMRKYHNIETRVGTAPAYRT